MDDHMTFTNFIEKKKKGWKFSFFFFLLLEKEISLHKTVIFQPLTSWERNNLLIK